MYNGTYNTQANTGANYIAGATSLAQADTLLDTQVGNNATALADILNTNGDVDGDGKVGIDGIA